METMKVKRMFFEKFLVVETEDGQLRLFEELSLNPSLKEGVPPISEEELGAARRLYRMLQSPTVSASEIALNEMRSLAKKLRFFNGISADFDERR